MLQPNLKRLTANICGFTICTNEYWKILSEENSPQWSRNELTSVKPLLVSRAAHGKTARQGRLCFWPRQPNYFQVKAARSYLQARSGLQLHAEPLSARSCRRSECEHRAPASTPGLRCNCYSWLRLTGILMCARQGTGDTWSVKPLAQPWVTFKFRGEPERRTNSRS